MACLRFEFIGNEADVVLIVFEVHVVGQVGIALKSPGNIAGAEGAGTVTLGEKVDRDVAGVVWIILHRDLIVDGVTRTYPNEIAAVDA